MPLSGLNPHSAQPERVPRGNNLTPRSQALVPSFQTDMKRTLVPTLFTILALFWSGCDRAFTDVGEATIEVVSPDVRVAITEPSIALELKVESVRDVTRVRTQGREFSFDASSQRWITQLDLHKGLNQFVVEAFVDDGPTRTDTISIFHLTYTHSVPTVEISAFGTGSHTLTPSLGGNSLLVGGSFNAGSGAAQDAHLLRPGGPFLVPVVDPTKFPRSGHTASELPDGRVLIVGGAVSGDIQSVDELVSPAEVFEPSNNTFKLIPVKGDPIRRMYHTTIVREVDGQFFVILLGGRGDIRYTPSPLLGIREDMRSFLLRNDSLISVSPTIGPFVEPVAGHTQTTLTSSLPWRGSRYLVNGLRWGATTEPTSFIMDFNSPFGIDISKTKPMQQPRIRHASIPIAPGIVALFGGRAEDPTVVYGTGELFVEEANMYFTLPFSIVPRFGLTATRLNNNSILLFGGFDATADALTDADFVSLDVQ